MATASAAAEPTPDTAKPASKKKLILIVAAAVLVLGAGASYFLLRGESDSPTAAKKAATVKKAEHKAPALYIPLDPPFVVNFDAGSSARFLQVAVQLMTRDLETADFIKQHDPVIRNDLLLLLGNVKFEEVQTREGKEALRQSALDAVRRIVKAEGADPQKLEAVYFTSFVMQ